MGEGRAAVQGSLEGKIARCVEQRFASGVLLTRRKIPRLDQATAERLKKSDGCPHHPHGLFLGFPRGGRAWGRD